MRNEACCLARTPSDTLSGTFQERGRLFSGDNAAGILQRLYRLLSRECETSEYVSAVGEMLALLPRCSTARLLMVEDNSVFHSLSFL